MEGAVGIMRRGWKTGWKAMRKMEGVYDEARYGWSDSVQSVGADEGVGVVVST